MINFWLNYEGVAGAGSMLGTKALQIFDDTVCVVRAVLRWLEFYAHESCGKCTPCREGTYWLVRLLRTCGGPAKANEVVSATSAVSARNMGCSFVRVRAAGSNADAARLLARLRGEVEVRCASGCTRRASDVQPRSRVRQGVTSKGTLSSAYPPLLSARST